MVDRDVIVDVLVLPRSSRNKVLDPDESGSIRVRVTAPPVGGAANKKMIELLASYFKVPKTNIKIITGAGGRRKRVRIAGLKR